MADEDMLAKFAFEMSKMGNHPRRDIIQLLTMIAHDSIAAAPQLVHLMLTKTAQAPPTAKLPLLYLIDSIAKSCPPFAAEFAKSLVDALVDAYATIPHADKSKVDRLVSLWSDNRVFSPALLAQARSALARLAPAAPRRQRANAARRPEPADARSVKRQRGPPHQQRPAKWGQYGGPGSYASQPPLAPAQQHWEAPPPQHHPQGYQPPPQEPYYQQPPPQEPYYHQGPPPARDGFYQHGAPPPQDPYYQQGPPPAAARDGYYQQGPPPADVHYQAPPPAYGQPEPWAQPPQYQQPQQPYGGDPYARDGRVEPYHHGAPPPHYAGGAGGPAGHDWREPSYGPGSEAGLGSAPGPAHDPGTGPGFGVGAPAMPQDLARHSRSRSPSQSRAGGAAAVTAPHAEPAPAEPAVLVKPTATDFDDITTPDPYVAHSLYSSSTRCATCGLRFDPADSAPLQAHMDWHFQENRKKENQQSMEWFATLSDWESGVQVVTKATTSFFDQQNEAAKQAEQEELHEDVRVVASDKHKHCEICGEAFKKEWDDDDEEWLLVHAIQLADGRVVHEACKGSD